MVPAIADVSTFYIVMQTRRHGIDMWRGLAYIAHGDTMMV
jgi:hypothetical protein